MNYFITLRLLLLCSVAVAQTRVDGFTGQIRVGVGISNKPETVVGNPVFLSADLGITLTKGWHIVAEGGLVAFRDAEYPTQSIGLFGGRSTYQTSYGGLRVSRNLLNLTQTGQLVLSAGADYLSVVEPHVTYKSGLILSGYIYQYEYKRYLNIPVQLDYIFGPIAKGPFNISLSGRWNQNAYHSFPAFSAGLQYRIYDRSRKVPFG